MFFLRIFVAQLAVYTALKDVIAAVKNSRTQGDTIASDSVDDIDNRTSLAIATFDSSLGLDRHEVSQPSNLISQLRIHIL